MSRIQDEDGAMSTLEEERQQVRTLGGQINQDARSNPNSPYAGRVVGILRGQVVVVADTLDEVAEALERLEPDPQRRYDIWGYGAAMTLDWAGLLLARTRYMLCKCRFQSCQ